MSVADVGHSPTVINTNNDATLLKYRYTFTSRYQDSSNDWFSSQRQNRDPQRSDGNLVSCHLRHSIMAQYCDSYGTNHDGRFKRFLGGLGSKNNAATISLKSTWKPTFAWKQDTLILKGVPHEDVHARDSQLNFQPLSSVGIHVYLAEKFGLLFKDKKNQYQLGPNLDFVLPTVTYNASTPPTRSNQRFQWLGEHFVGIKPRDY